MHHVWLYSGTQKFSYNIFLAAVLEARDIMADIVVYISNVSNMRDSFAAVLVYPYLDIHLHCLYNLLFQCCCYN